MSDFKELKKSGSNHDINGLSSLNLNGNHGQPNDAIVSHKQLSGQIAWKSDWNRTEEKFNLTNPCYSIFIVDPELNGSMLNKYITYTVKTEPHSYIVKRRYNEFSWLRDTLLVNYPGLFIPSLPSTHSFKSSGISGSHSDPSSDFVRNRMAQLNLFVKQVSSIPFLRTDKSLLAFLSLPGEKDFKSYVDNLPPDGGEDTQGSKIWKNILDNVPVPVDANTAAVDVKIQLDKLITTLKKLEEHAMLTGQFAMKYSRELHSLSSQINSWYSVESELGNPELHEAPNAHGGVVKIYMDTLDVGFKHLNQSFQYIPKLFATVLVASIQFQIVQVEGFREFIRARERMIKELESAEIAKLKAIEEKMKVSSGGKSGGRLSIFMKGGDTDEVLQKREENVVNLTRKIKYITAGLVYGEIDRFNYERMENIRCLSGNLVSANVEMCKRQEKQWIEAALISNVDLSEFQENINCIFTDQSADAIQIFADV